MIAIQEEGGTIEDFYYAKIHNAFQLIEEISTSTQCETEYLKEAVGVTLELLKEYQKFVETEEKKLVKVNAKSKVFEKLKKGSDFYEN